MRLIARLFGGLGNQLFQYSAALRAARHYRVDPEFLTTPSPHTAAFEELLGERLRRASPASRLRAGQVPAEWPRWRRRLGHRVVDVLRLAGRFDVIKQTGRQAFDDVEWPTTSSLFLDGYFLNPSCHEATSEELARTILRAKPTAATTTLGAGRLAVHFRRGDFIGLGWGLPMEYYLRALDATGLDRTAPLWVVSDDPVLIELTAEYFEHRGWHVDGSPRLHSEPAVSDFWALATAQHVISANSTFSWWACLVGDAMHARDDRIVVMPQDWGPLGPNRLLRPSWRTV